MFIYSYIVVHLANFINNRCTLIPSGSTTCGKWSAGFKSKVCCHLWPRPHHSLWSVFCPRVPLWTVLRQWSDIPIPAGKHLHSKSSQCKGDNTWYAFNIWKDSYRPVNKPINLVITFHPSTNYNRLQCMAI